MNKLVVLIAISLSILGCKKGENQNATSQVEKPGVYEVIFIDVNNTHIPDDIDPKVLKESRLFSNLNLTKPDQFWKSKNNFYAHGMGSIKTQESGKYYFRLTSTGKIIFKLNNKELVKVNELDKKEVTSKSAFLDSGATVFEFEYFLGIWIHIWYWNGQQMERIMRSYPIVFLVIWMHWMFNHGRVMKKL